MKKQTLTRCPNTVDLELGHTDSENNDENQRSLFSLLGFGLPRLLSNEELGGEPTGQGSLPTLVEELVELAKKPEHREDDPRRIVLVGCVAGKNNPGMKTQTGRAGTVFMDRATIEAKELYSSTLWTKRRRYAESSGDTWGIMSAFHGIIKNDAQIETYDFSIKDRKEINELRGEELFARKLIGGIAIVSGSKNWDIDGKIILEIHAGAPYVKMVRDAIRLNGLEDQVQVETPVKGLQIGELLRWYNEQDEQGLELQARA
jgi:Family of unknown function (DUF6884)